MTGTTWASSGRVTLIVEAALSASTGTYGVWDSAQWNTGTFGPDVVWTNITHWTLGVDTRRQFQRESNAYDAGSAKIILDNTDGRFSPSNLSGPYVTGGVPQIRPGRPIRVRATYTPISGAAVTFPIFYGLMQSWIEDQPSSQASIVTVTATDPFSLLAAFDGFAQTPQGAGEPSGIRVMRIAANAGWTGNTNVDTGNNTIQATTLASNALTELKLVADSEGGAVWCGPDGTLNFDGQYALIEKRRSATIQATFADTAALFAAGAFAAEEVRVAYSADLIRNMASYARKDGNAQIAGDNTSRALYGDRLLSRTDLLNTADADVAQLALRDVSIRKDPEMRVEFLRFDPQNQPSDVLADACWLAVANQQLEMRSQVRVVRTPRSSTAYTIDRQVFITGIAHQITPESWKIGLDFASATPWLAFTSSQWVGIKGGQNTIFSDPATPFMTGNAVWDTAVWAW